MFSFFCFPVSPVLWVLDTWWCALPTTQMFCLSASWMSCRKSLSSPTTGNASAARCGRILLLNLVSFCQVRVAVTPGDAPFSHWCLSARCPPPDTFIQKTKQRYNSPRSLSTKINLADMQTEIKLRPPYQLSPEDLRAINGFSVHMPSKYKGLGRNWASPPHTLALESAEPVMPLTCLAAPTQVLEPVTLPGIVSCMLSVLCGGLNLLRGVHAIESVLQVQESPARPGTFSDLTLCFWTWVVLKERPSPHRTTTRTLITWLPSSSARRPVCIR